jgi:glycosyltransferase involved in cell wall biosynthesis
VKKISIITPVFNAKNFIAACIENVAHFKHLPIEHLIYDGCSTDGTWEIILDYQKQHPHIQAYHEKDTGQSNAMNKGIQMAKAEIIGFLNADDFYEPHTLPLLLEKIKSALPLTLWLGNCQLWGNNNQKLSLNKPKAFNYYSLLAGYEAPYNPSAYFYHKSLHDHIGLYDEDDHYTMDLDFLIKAYRIAHVEYDNRTWGNFRFITGSKTFEDAQSQKMFQRIEQLKQKTIDGLSWSEKKIVQYYQLKKRALNSLRRKCHLST